MKKTVIIILAILPIFLIITISFAARILSFYQYIPVEKVQFVNSLNKPYELNEPFELNMGEKKSTNIRIFPELATNKEVSYESSNENVCTIDSDGNVYGVYYGNAQITVTTKDSNKQAVLQVSVKADKVIGVTLPQNEVTLTLGEKFKLEPTVDLPVAMDKNVLFSVDDPQIIKVSANGEITTLKEGVATVTVITVDGGYTATCTVTVIQGTPAIAFTFAEQDFITVQGVFHVSAINEIDLYSYVSVNTEKTNVNEVKFCIKDGSNRATLNENGLLTLQKKGPVTIKAYVGNVDSPTYETEIILTLPLN